MSVTLIRFSISNFSGSTPVSGVQNFQANSKKRKNLVRTRLKVDFKAKFEEIAKPLPYGAGEENRTLVTSLENWRSTIELHPQLRSFYQNSSK